MSKIFGIQVKSLKIWEARDGYGTTANIYIDNKKVGTFYDDGNGGMPDIEFDDNKYYDVLKDRASKYFKKYPPVFGDKALSELKDGETLEKKYDFCYDMTAFMEEIIKLHQREKAFKNIVKKGCPFLLCSDYPFLASGPHPIPEYLGWHGDDADKIANMWIKAKKKQYPHLIVDIYRSLDDFIIE